jgi:cytochrome c oxidase subunit II
MSVAIGGLALLLAACTQDYPYNSLAPEGPVADKQAELYWLVFWIAVGVFVIVEGLLVYALYRFRRRGPDDTPRQIHGNTRLEILWTIIPALLLAGVAVPTVGTIFDLAQTPTDALEVRVTAHQWWWEVEYPSLDVVTANEIHVPTDQPVAFTLESKDVIHSFSVPRLAGKQDVIPGRTNTLTIVAPRAGTYFGQCQEFCGLSHAQMRFRVVAQEPGDFQAWVDGQRPPATSMPPPEIENTVTGTCMSCHTITGVGESLGARPAPDLTHLAGRETIAAGLLNNDPEDLARWLANPPGLKAGSKMPDYDLTDDQIDALVEYLQTLE